jgi:cell wall-associated NlpC family hydrolase
MVPFWVSGYIGIPFVSGGRDVSGCDCYGLVRLVLFDQFGYRMPLLASNYQDACDTRETGPLIQHYVPLLKGKRISNPESGSVAVVRFRGRTSHLGIFVDGEYILHTLPGADAHCVDAGHLFMRGAIEGIYRVSEDYRITPSV